MAARDMLPKYHCDACETDLSDVVRIKCAECEDFDLCAECFAQGVELHGHRNDHKYRVIDTLNFPIISLEWGADEELALLDGIKMYGMGNWEDIAEHIGTKTKQQVEDHYLQTYINVVSCPLPDLSIRFDQSQIEDFRQKRKEREGQLRLEKKRAGASEKPPKPVPVTSQPLCHEVAGYMPYRQEFDVEHENEAESLISQISFNDDDSPEDTELKLKVLDIYNSKLDQRQERKDFILDRQLINLKQQLANDKRRKDYKELYNQHRVFARFQSASDFELFIDGLINEQRIRSQIAQLHEWRRNGVTTLVGGEQYEADKKKRTSEQFIRKARESPFAVGIPNRRGQEPYPIPSKSRRSGPLDLSNAEDAQLLSPKEYEICSTLRIQPKAYLTMKEMMIRECNQQGYLKRSHARRMIRIDVNKTGKVFDFFVAAGWIKPNAKEAEKS